MAISRKQKQIMAFSYTDYDALICDGAIRSGKTVFMTLSFIDDAMRRFNGQRFGICGKTVDSTVKNIITPYLSLGYAQEKYRIQWRRSDKLLVVSDGQKENIFEVFGGKDESSFMLIQGRTLAGVLLDEVALQPRSFVEQALARCSVEGSKMWFNCNPDSPEHWFYKEWICAPQKRNAIRLHFQLEDNPALSQKIINRYKALYAGVFYRRYILGEWCMAEGLIYQFDKETHTVKEMPKAHLRGGEWYISCDYGTLNPFSAGLWCVHQGRAIRVAEYYYSGRGSSVMKTDEEYYAELEKLAGDRDIRSVIVDPSAASFIATIRRHGRFAVRKARNEVLPGIRLTAAMLHAGVIKIGTECEDAIREFGLYRWDEKGEVDKPVKENDHAMDDIRYFCSTVMRRNREARQIMRGMTDDEED